MTSLARHDQTPQARVAHIARFSQPHRRQLSASPFWRWLALMLVAISLLLAGWVVAMAVLALARVYLERLLL